MPVRSGKAVIVVRSAAAVMGAPPRETNERDPPVGVEVAVGEAAKMGEFRPSGEGRCGMADWGVPARGGGGPAVRKEDSAGLTVENGEARSGWEGKGGAAAKDFTAEEGRFAYSDGGGGGR